jgi:membrane protein required for colicin V production
MNVLDIVIAVCLLVGFVRGIMKGLFIEVASLVALIGGIWGSIHFSYFVADFLKESVSWSEKNISLAAFAITFVIIIIAVGLLGKFLTKLADLAALGMVNKILGGVFGLVKIGLVLSIVFTFFDRMNSSISFIDNETLDESILYEPLKSIAPAIFPSIIKEDGDEDDLIDTVIKKIE